MRFIILSFCLFLLPHTSLAATLRVSPNVEAQVDSALKKVSLRFSLKNEGDEPVVDVSIALPTLKQSKLVTKELAIGEKETVSVELSFDQIGINLPGSYAVPYRVEYKDIQLYPSSPAYIAIVHIEPIPMRTIVAQFNSQDGIPKMSVSTSNNIKGTLLNTTPDAISIEKLLAVSPLELPVEIQTKTLPLTLEAGKELSFIVTAKNAGALVGSLYNVKLLTTGTTQEKHFAEETNLQINIIPPAPTMRYLIFGAIAIIFFIGFFKTTKKS